MNYTELCKYVFLEERVPWNMREIKDTHRQCVTAKQICYFLCDWFYPRMKYVDMSDIFKQNPSNVGAAIKNIKRIMEYDKDLDRRIGKYINHVRRQIVNETELPAIEMNEVTTSEEATAKLRGLLKYMAPIVHAYCDLTGMQLTKKAS